jgi:hypothetical protein
MRLSERLSRFIEDKKAQIQKGIMVSEQMNAEKLRRKQEKAKYLEPGTVRYGLAFKQSPTEVMRMAYDKRKMDREKKYNK